MEILEKALKPHPDVLVSRVGKEMIMLHHRNETYYELNATGTLIWEELARGTLPSTICEQIAHENMMPLAQVQDDTRAFLEGLLAQALIV